MFLVSGPSGVGKSTLVARLRVWRPDLWLSVSATTRPPRPGEEPEVDYYFCTKAAFDDLIAAGDLLEWAEVFGQRYGTPSAPLEEALRSGRLVILDVDVQGARSVKARMPNVVSIFIAPPSLDALHERLRQRRTESPEDLDRRWARAALELEAQDEFDHVVVNDDRERAWRAIADIITGSESA